MHVEVEESRGIRATKIYCVEIWGPSRPMMPDSHHKFIRIIDSCLLLKPVYYFEYFVVWFSEKFILSKPAPYSSN